MLVIVQDRETQFDPPLYAYMQARGEFDTMVFYTQTIRVGKSEIDHETGRPPLWDHLAQITYPHRHLPAKGFRDTWALFREILAFRPTLVIVSGYYPPSHLLLARLLKSKGIRVGLRSDNSLEHSSFKGAKGLLKRAALPPILRLYDSWHPVGTLARDYLGAVSHSDRPVYLFPYGVDNDWFAEHSSAARSQRAAARRKLGWSESDFVVLGVMKWHPREDPLVLIEAVRLARMSNSRIRLLLLGDGPLRPQVEEKTEALGDAVALPGYVAYSALPGYYGISELFVHPAPNEPWGVSVNEAMACGLPVLVSEGVGARVGLVEEGVNGKVFPVGGAKALAEKLENLIGESERLQSMGEASRNAVSNWDYEHTYLAMQAALREVGKGYGR